MKTPAVESIDVAKGRELDIVDVTPRPSTPDQFVLEQPDRGLIRLENTSMMNAT